MEIFNIDNLIYLFIIILILEYSSLNIESIKRIFKNKDQEKIDFFLNDLDKKNIRDILNFLDDYILNEDELKKLLKSKYNNNIDFHKKLISTQEIDCDFLESLISSKIVEEIPDNLLSNYIILCTTTLNKKTLDYFKKNKSLRLKGALVLTHPLTFEKKSVIKVLSKPFLDLNEWLLKLFKNKDSVLLIAIGLTVIVMYLNKSLFYKEYALYVSSINPILFNTTNIGLVFLLINLIISIILFTSFSSLYFKINAFIFGFIYRDN